MINNQIKSIFLCSLLSLFSFACNQAPVGFGAPFGSTVSITEAASYTVTAGNTQVVVISGSVVLPLNLNNQQGDQQQQQGQQQQGAGVQQNPGNNIYVNLTCFGCEFINANSESLGTFVETTTNNLGTYAVNVLLQSPFAIGAADYEATVIADIIVANASTTLSVTDGS